MKWRLTFLAMLSTIVLLSSASARNSVRTHSPKPFMLSRLPYEVGPVKPTQPVGLDDYWNVRVNSDTTTQIQNEEQIALNPMATSNLVAVWRDFRYGYRRVGYGTSSDHGVTWSDQLFPQYTYPWQSDPGITFNRDGVFFSVMVSYDPAEGGEDGIMVVKSDDNGQTWSEPTAVVDSVVNQFEDKELMACDRTMGQSAGNLYVSWTPFYGQSPWYDSTHIMISASYDSGLSFEAPLIISDQPAVQWSVPAVGADGQVYVAWISYDPGSIKFDRSFDQGHTWGQDSYVHYVDFVAGYINGNLYTFSFPAMDVDIFDTPWRGRIYIAYADYREGGDDLDIYMTTSDDDGYNWSTPVAINDMLTYPFIDQFHPWTSVDTNGVVTVVFYDRRNDPNNLLMDLYFTQSTDGGETWSINQRITTVSSDPTAGSRAGLIGEYVGLISWDGVPYTAWTDTRNGNQDVFASALDSTITTVPITKDPLQIPLSIELQAYPNPFNPTTILSFILPEAGQASVKIYDVTGRKVTDLVDGCWEPGLHRQLWDASHLASGIYFARLHTVRSDVVRKLLLVK
jgi:hypothetical protein